MKAKEIVKRFVEDERALETVEYAVIAGLIVVGTIATITAVGVYVKVMFNSLLTNLGGTAVP